MNLTEGEARELRLFQAKKNRMVIAVIVAGLLGSFVGAFGFQIGKAWVRGEHTAHVDGAVIFLPLFLFAAVIVLFAANKKRRPANKIDLLIADRQDRLIPWLMLIEAVAILIVAGAFVGSPRFSVGPMFNPLIVLHVLLRFRRDEDEFRQAIALKAMAAGFVSAFISLCGLILVAGFASNWLTRLTPMALAVPMAAAGCAFTVLSWRGNREG